MAERERFGYTDAGGNRVSALRDMFDGGGRGRSGSQFEGGGVLSSIGNAMGGPSAFGGGDDSNRGAVIGRTIGGMMFGPLGFLGGGILGNMIGRGRGTAMAPQTSPTPSQRPAPAMASAMAPRASMRPQMSPAAMGRVPMSAQPGALSVPPTMPSIMDLPSATQRFIAQYGGMPGMQAGYTPPPLPGAVVMNQPVSMPPATANMPMFPAAGYMPRTRVPVDPMMDPRNMVSLPVDRATGRPLAMTPPRLR